MKTLNEKLDQIARAEREREKEETGGAAWLAGHSCRPSWRWSIVWAAGMR